MTQTTDTPFERFAFYGICVLYALTTFALASGNIISFFLFFTMAFTAAILFGIFASIKIEKDHLKALTAAEAELSDMIVSDMKTLPPDWQPAASVFIMENCVLGVNTNTTFFWSFRKFFGGESKSLTKLALRARREATVRVLRKAKKYGANAVWNIRYETSVVQTNKGSKGIEVLAYATAFSVRQS